jgi:hypothetical protein
LLATFIVASALFLEQELIYALATTALLLDHIHARDKLSMLFWVVAIAKNDGLNIGVHFAQQAAAINAMYLTETW